MIKVETEQGKIKMEVKGTPAEVYADAAFIFAQLISSIAKRSEVSIEELSDIIIAKGMSLFLERMK